MYGQRISIHQRCSELTRLLNSEENGNELKDAHRLFTTILGDIFGYPAGGVGLGWNLPAFSRKNSDFKDFATLHNFLSSRGPLLQRLVHKLVSDPQSRRFEFPLTDLTPFFKTSSGPDPFILPRLAPDQSVLYLNAFEYYFFHFAYVLVRPQNHWQNINWVPGDALYPILLEDYMSYFLPCDGSEICGSSSPAHHFNIRLNSPTTNLSPSLLKKQQPTPIIPSHPQQPPFESIHSALTTEKLWRSEVVINVLSLFWLHSDDPSVSQEHFSFQDLNVSADRSASAHLPFVPSVEHVRVVRMVVKHLHFFVNSAGPNNATFMDNFKSEVWPCLRKKLYLFLCSSLDNWPLDASFRLILETWLSYIQPWRYTDSSNGIENNADIKHLFKWHPFVIENNKFYTTLFKRILRRFFRLDLSCNKNAYMLYRLCKVFDQAGLSDTLRDVEAAYKGNSVAGTQKFKSTISNGISHRDMNVLVGHTNKNPLHVYGTDQLFDSLFEPNFVSLVQKLMSEYIIPSYGDLRTLLLNLQEDSKKKRNNFWKMLFFQTSSFSGDSSLVETDPEETQKTIGYLESIVDQLVSIFDLSSSNRNKLKSARYTAENRHQCVTTNDDTVDYSSFHLDPSSEPISPEVRWKIINGIVKPDIRYTGNPDLTLIRTDEVRFLIRTLYKVSKSINTRFSKDFEQYYEREDFIGYLSREILTQPSYYYQNEKKLLGIMTPLEKQYLPARIVLRPLGSFKAFFFLGLFYFVYSILFGYSTLGSTFTLISYYIILILCRAVYKYVLHSLDKFHNE